MNSLPPAPTPLEDVFNTPPSQLPRNKSTEAIHNRETLWQIYIPMGAGILLMLAVLLLAGVAGFTGNPAATRVWADVSLVFVVLQVLIIALPVLALMIGLAVGVWYLVKILPPYMKVAQDYTLLAARKVEQAAHYAVKPVIKTRAAVAGFDNFVQNIRKFFRK
jgi:hypothetical protein